MAPEGFPAGDSLIWVKGLGSPDSPRGALPCSGAYARDEKRSVFEGAGDPVIGVFWAPGPLHHGADDQERTKSEDRRTAEPEFEPGRYRGLLTERQEQPKGNQ